MTSRRTFTTGQWVTAASVALMVHALLAWSLIATGPATQGLPTGQGDGLTLASLSLGAGHLPLLTDVAAADGKGIPAGIPLPSEAVLQPLAPPSIQPMTEVVPDEPKRSHATAPRLSSQPKAKSTLSKTSKSQAKKRERHDRGKVSPRGGSQKGKGRTGSSTGSRKSAGAGHGKDFAKGKPAGLERKAAPQPGNPRPKYPRLARGRGEEGRVTIRVSVSSDGRVANAIVASSSGYGSLDRAALQAVKRWRFRPALRAGKPVTATLTVPVVFRLKG